MFSNGLVQIPKYIRETLNLKDSDMLHINLDGKNVTRNKAINIINMYSESFLDNLEKTVRFFTKKYKCLAIFGADEVSFIFEKPLELINDMNTDKSNYSTEIISVFSQYFYDY